MEQNNQLALFQNKEVRKIWHNGEWWFSIIDAIEVLSNSSRPRKYWNDLKKKLITEGFVELSENIGQLKMMSTDGKYYKTDAANSATMMRIILSVPSPNAEPFRQWLVQVGQERIAEIDNPEIAIERAKEIYKAKGYSDEWIKNRLQSIETRKLLTDEWKLRGVTEGSEYSLLTAIISKGTFGITPSEHSQLKGLEKENLRDHMTPLELIFSALGEEVTRRLAIQEDAQGFNENREMAEKGGSVAGDALKRTEQQTGLKVVSNNNYLGLKSSETPKEIPDK